MWQAFLGFALTHYGYALPAVLAYLSTLHTKVDKSPVAKALLRILATFAGPLNWPHMRELAVALARAVVAAADAKEEEPQAANPTMTELVEKLRDLPAFGPKQPAPTFASVLQAAKEQTSSEKERAAAEAASK